MFGRKKPNLGLGQYKLNRVYSDEVSLRRWFDSFQAVLYRRIIVQRTVTGEIDMAENPEAGIHSHYEYLRGLYMEALEGAETPQARRNYLYGLTALKKFKPKMQTLIDGVRRMNSEEGE